MKYLVYNLFILCITATTLFSVQQEHECCVSFSKTNQPYTQISPVEQVLEKFQNHSRLSSQATLNELGYQAMLYHNYCIQHFGMTPKEVKKLSKQDPHKVVNELLHNTSLDDDAITELWNMCKAKHTRSKHKKDIYAGDKQIQKELDKRHQQEVEQLRLTNLYNRGFLNLHSHPADLDDLYIQRSQALEKTISQNFKVSTQSHKLHPEVTGMLTAYDIDYHQFEHLSGTTFQHQLYSEIIDSLHTCNEIYHDYELTSSILIPQILNFADASRTATESESFPLALQLNDLCTTLSSYGLAVCEGIFDSAYDTVDMIIHAPQTGKQISKLITHVVTSTLSGIKSVFYDSDKALSEQFNKGRQGAVDATLYLCSHFTDWYNKSSGQDKTRIASRIGADILITPRLLHKLCTSCCKLINAVPELQSLTNFTDILQEHKIANPTPYTELTFNLMEGKAKAAQKAASTTLLNQPSISLDQALKQLTTHGAPDKTFQRELKALFSEIFNKEELLKLCENAKKKYNHVTVMYNGKLTKLTCDIEHIMTYNLKFTPNPQTSLVEGYISGGHFGIKTKELEKAGHIIIHSEEILSGGARALEYKHSFGNIIAQKTEYPLSWSPEKIMSANLEAFSNFTNERILKNGMIARKGTVNNLEIVTVLKKLKNNELKMITAHPYNPKKLIF